MQACEFVTSKRYNVKKNKGYAFVFLYCQPLTLKIVHLQIDSLNSNFLNLLLEISAYKLDVTKVIIMHIFVLLPSHLIEPKPGPVFAYYVLLFFSLGSYADFNNTPHRI